MEQGVPKARVEAEWLLAHVLGCSRTVVLSEGSLALEAMEERQLCDLAERRGARIPLQHLLGTTVFYGLELAVNGRVLVPRPETEQLAELALEFAMGLDAPMVLDWGTGSGCLAIALAARCPKAVVYALDVSSEALEVARANAARHGLKERISFHEGDGCVEFPGTRLFDLIVANPPYIRSGHLASLAPEVRDHDPRLALDGGEDGLAFYRALARVARGRLAGQIFLEVGDDQAEAVTELFEAGGWHVDNVAFDLNNLPRIVVASVSAP